MINYKDKTIVLGDNVTPIKQMAVWWFGPTGLVPSLDLALQMHEALGYEAEFYMVWKATPVAIGENGLYEELR